MRDGELATWWPSKLIDRLRLIIPSPFTYRMALKAEGKAYNDP